MPFGKREASEQHRRCCRHRRFASYAVARQVAVLRDDGVCVYSESRKKARCAAYLFPNFLYFKKTDVHAAGFQFEGFPSSSPPQARFETVKICHINYVDLWLSYGILF